jgi:hypothetical protein
VLIILAVLAFLIYAVTQGSLIAGIVLAIISTIVLVCVGAGITLVTQKMANDKAQGDFMANAKENLSIITLMQKVQNLQNKTVMDQLKGATRLSLPEPDDPADVLEYDDIVFEELDE